jgi:hypothetical protein
LGIIKQELLVKGDKKEERLNVLFDSWTSISLIRGDIAKELSTPKELLIQREFTAADGHKISCRYLSDLVVEIEGKRIGIEAFLIDDLPAPLVLGALDMEAYMIKLDFAKRKLDLTEFTGLMLAL